MKSHAQSLHLVLGPDAAATAIADAAIECEVLSLFDECAGGLQRYVRALGLPAGVADDVIQETFLALFTHLRLGRPRHQLRGWLYVVAHNQALKQRALAKRWQSLDPASGAALRLADTRPDAAQTLIARERRGRLRAVVRALPERDRLCLHLRSEGLNYRQIASTLNVSLGAVAKSLARAFDRLVASEARR
jgi:RNA polymerase sigma-70 factor (ECF subfamily)